MAEQLANSAATTLSSNINNVVTSLTVANGAVFPATGDFRIKVADAVTGANSELMLCTARATNVLTITRGIESTTAVAHNTPSDVTHVLTKGGLDAYLASTFGVWQAYTPVWTSSGTAPALGNGSVANSRYTQIGKTVFGQMSILFGSTSTFGTGVYFFSLPVTASATVGGTVFASTHIFDNSTSQSYEQFTALATTTTMTSNSPAAPTVTLSATTPFTFAVNDFINMKFIYEAA
jgi:hypothetical protein